VAAWLYKTLAALATIAALRGAHLSRDQLLRAFVG
jgi:hypothetical protein